MFQIFNEIKVYMFQIDMNYLCILYFILKNEHFKLIEKNEFICNGRKNTLKRKRKDRKSKMKLPVAFPK